MAAAKHRDLDSWVCEGQTSIDDLLLTLAQEPHIEPQTASDAPEAPTADERS